MDSPKKNQVNLDLGLDENLEEKLEWMYPHHGEYRISNLSIDARGRKAPIFKYQIEIAQNGGILPQIDFNLEKIPPNNVKPLIVGAGPCGLFAALRFVERGVKPILIERGSTCEERLKKINRFWRYGELDPHNNVCFGEGGAGMYSDGKLITRIKSPYIPYVLNRLVKMGAPEEIQWLSNPHVGSDKIRRLLPTLRNYLLQNGCEIYFDTEFKKLNLQQKQITGVEALDLKTQKIIQFQSDFVILATGHSANEIFNTLHEQDVFMEPKSFAMGVRVEHPQKFINSIQYKEYAEHPKLKAAPYKLTHHDHQTNIGVYSFCMCPGGYVLPSSTEETGVVCNGMSNYHRNSPFANSAIVVSIDHEKLFPNDLFGGLKFRTELEEKGQKLITAKGLKKELPAESLYDFLNGTTQASKLKSVQKSSSLSGHATTLLHEIFPKLIYKNLLNGFKDFNNKMKGFVSEDATVYGVESRTSCPIRITRNPETLESFSHKGLYPAGEGAGYAGGITSAACDGVRIAEIIISQIHRDGSEFSGISQVGLSKK